LEEKSTSERWWARGLRKERAKKPKEPRRKGGGQAVILSHEDFERFREHVLAKATVPESTDAVIKLSFYEGLRVGEIHELLVRDACGADGRAAPSIIVRASCSKSKETRKIPTHPEVAAAINRFREKYPEAQYFAYTSRWGGALKRRTLNGLTCWFSTEYKKAGLIGASSHSGRRSFVTHAAREANTYGASIRDVARMAGHRDLKTTEKYIEPSDNLSELVASMGKKRKPSDSHVRSATKFAESRRDETPRHDNPSSRTSGLREYKRG
jgi:integrase